MHRFILILGLFFPLSLWAQSTSATTFSSLQLEPTARMMALGGMQVALSDEDVTTFLVNPANIKQEMMGMLSLSYLSHLSDINASTLAYAHTLPRIGTVAGGIRFLNYGNFERLDTAGESLGNFNAYTLAMTVGYSYRYTKNVTLGASINTLLSRVDGLSATALSTDLGILYEAPSQNLSVGATVNHLGKVFSSLGETEDTLPTDVRVGLTKKLTYLPLRLSVTGNQLHKFNTDNETAKEIFRHLVFGGEFLLGNSFNLRLGYNHQRNQDLRIKNRLDLAGLGLGFGLKIKRFTFDYGYNTWSSLGQLHQFSLRTGL